ncbi:DNA recombination protein RmuC [Sphingomonas oleivorans]|uniref:DNA recombination protein RmuC homolog n=1 Tax=Sphingomonas oleivorans TaxID=1735121 RepID=A0A2T5FWH9_9SPHN|nr:DNA recombination protein RmuC [Sphingomonas oleivorans]PTQ10141.1 DNA recombination protein RmuC [Sphingomonas oleivorans]
MNIGLALVAIFGALLFGLLCGWLAFGRSGALLRGERDRLNERLRGAETAFAAAEERAKAAGLLRTTLDAVTAERDEALRALAEERARAKEREEAHGLRLAELREAKEALSQQFGEVGAKLLGEAQKAFLERADARFRQSEEKSGLELKALLQPVTERLQRYEEGVARVEQERREAYGNLTGLIDSMRAGQEAVRSEAQKLVNSLRSAPKARGRWGEQQLKNVLETCGLSEHADFQTEVSVGVEEGRLRPDAIVRVPGGRALVIDAKVSLNAYQDAFAAVDEAERARGLSAHAAAMKAHVNGLGAKAYWAQFADAPDYVIMFVPGEHFLSAALEHDPTLWDFAFEKRVLLATPTNLIAIARTVAAVWRQERLAAEAKKIGDLGKLMYDRLAVAAGHLKTVGGGLATAVNNYNKFVSSFESRVLVTGREFQKLNIETGARAIEEIPPVDALARYGDMALPVPDQGRAEAAE